MTHIVIGARGKCLNAEAPTFTPPFTMPDMTEAEARTLLLHRLLCLDCGDWSHEHCGNRRRGGPETWRSWRYDEVLRHFCGQTNIDFRPAPSDPEQRQRRSKQ
jgi:hypothetical protein